MVNELVELATALPVEETVITALGVLNPWNLISTFSPALKPRTETPTEAPDNPVVGTSVRLGCTV
jgi:hypothetical protein